jgi:hypothetical protein
MLKHQCTVDVNNVNLPRWLNALLEKLFQTNGFGMIML